MQVFPSSVISGPVPCGARPRYVRQQPRSVILMTRLSAKQEDNGLNTRL